MEALQPDGLDREEVGGDDRGGVLADELAPAALAAASSGRDALAAQDLGHAHVGDPKAEFERLALDSAVAPGGILAGEPHDQVSPLAMAGRALPRWASGKGAPLAADQLAMPAEQGCWSRQQGIQARSQKDPAQGGEQEPITRLPGGLAELALEDAELMAQGQHLGAKLGVGAGADQDEIGEEADKLVGEGEKHGSGIMPDRSRPAEIKPV